MKIMLSTFNLAQIIGEEAYQPDFSLDIVGGMN